MRNYLAEWLSEEESVVVPTPAQSVSKQRRTKRSEETEGGCSAGQTSGKQIENDGARMVWTETREAGGGTAGESSSGPLAEEQAVLPMALTESQVKQAARGALYAAMGKVGRVELYAAMGKVGRVERLILGEERGQAVPLALSGWSQRAETVDHLDRAVQRDARRYDGGFSLY